MIVLDTATWIWRASDPKRLTTSARRAIDEAERALGSAISVWEVAMLVAMRRIQLDRPVERRVDIARAPRHPARAARAGDRGAQYETARRVPPRSRRSHHRRDRARKRGADHHAGRENPLVPARSIGLVEQGPDEADVVEISEISLDLAQDSLDDFTEAIRVEIPSDAEGCSGRECPVGECRRYFEVKGGTGLPLASAHGRGHGQLGSRAGLRDHSRTHANPGIGLALSCAQPAGTGCRGTRWLRTWIFAAHRS